MTATATPTRSHETRHADLATRLQIAITRGDYGVGCLLPTELQLAEMHGVSRQTVRMALKALEDRGLISRKKGVGSRVENAEAASRGYRHTVDSLDDLVHVAATEIRHLAASRMVTLDRPEARLLEAPLGSQWLCLEGSRVDARRQERSLSCFRIFVDARYASVAQRVHDEPQSLVARILEREFGLVIEEVQQQVFAIVLNAELAQVLKTQEGMPALRILRHYKTDRRSVVEITETIYPADRARISSRLLRNKPSPEIP